MCEWNLGKLLIVDPMVGLARAFVDVVKRAAVSAREKVERRESHGAGATDEVARWGPVESEMYNHNHNHNNP